MDSLFFSLFVSLIVILILIFDNEERTYNEYIKIFGIIFVVSFSMFYLIDNKYISFTLLTGLIGTSKLVQKGGDSNIEKKIDNLEQNEVILEEQIKEEKEEEREEEREEKPSMSGKGLKKIKKKTMRVNIPEF